MCNATAARSAPPTAQGHGLRNRVPTQHGAGGPLRLPPRALPGLERCGAPEALVTDSGFVFLANWANDIYRASGIRKEEIEYLPETGKVGQVGRLTLFEMSFASTRPRRFELDTWDDVG